VDASREGIELLLSEGYEWAFIDTPPAMLGIIQDAIAAADVVLIPSRSSALDVLAVNEVVELCRDHHKPFAFVLNAVMTSWGKIADSAVEYLANMGPVCEARIAHRKPFTSAMTVGKSGHEIDRTGAARREIDALWSELQKLANNALRAKARANG
jgi:chromosome partitioning protein